MDVKYLLFGLLVISFVVAGNSTNSTVSGPPQPIISDAAWNGGVFLVWCVGFCLLFPAGWFVGRLQDLRQRCKWMRLVFKKDYRLVKFKHTGGIVLFGRIIDVSEGTFLIGTKQWVMSKTRMFLDSDEKVGLNLQKLDENPSYDEGCPCLYVNPDTCVPLGFAGDDLGINPEELGSTFGGWFMNQVQKAMATIKQIRTILMIILFAALAAAIFAYLAHMDIGNQIPPLAGNISDIHARLGSINIPATFVPSNATQIISQKGVSGGG